ncbi:galactose oxidase early set domain-containing protein [Streptomyces caatingaensis]|uniref:Galactose oxidase n=1 Tax=Streptomyces caatingaensis TaxID=1678637 RepID=A0A0K9X9D1_9ACTN|nr:galactose oxidase early set domain-containing protein [Streptomyces caatingaensis]KNB49676.1 galactose oxidase [Streptomyces caatingaensis]
MSPRRPLPRRRALSRRRPRTALAAGAATVIALSTLTLLSTPAPATTTPTAPSLAPARLRAAVRPAEVAALGKDEAEALAWRRLVAADDTYPQSMRTQRFNDLTASQAQENAPYDVRQFGKWTDYFPSPDFGDHVALLPTGKVLVFSFEMFNSNPTIEPAPTQQVGKNNTGRAYVWDPKAGTGPSAFKAVPPPEVDMDDDTGVRRAAPVFCAGHSYLPNGMVGVFGGNFGADRDGAGARFAFVFDPWTETWHRQQDMRHGRWYPGVVTTADGRQLIMSGQRETGYGTPSTLIERFPARTMPVLTDKAPAPERQPLDAWRVQAPYTQDYPHLFALRDGKVYGFGREAGEQFAFDPQNETRAGLPARPDGGMRLYGSAVPLPNGTNGPDSVLVLGGDNHSNKVFKFTSGPNGGQWTEETPRNYSRTQDDTLILPNGNLFTVNGAFHIRDYGAGLLNPNVSEEWMKRRYTETRDASGRWTIGPAQRLPRGYHSNAVLLPDGRVMVTGDELQQMAANPNIKSGYNGTIEIFEPPYLQQGSRPDLRNAPNGPVAYGATFRVDTNTPTRAAKAVLVAPVTSTHAVDTSQRRLELPIRANAGGALSLQAPPSAQDAPPGYYMLFLLDGNGVPSEAQWVQLRPNA